MVAIVKLLVEVLTEIIYVYSDNSIKVEMMEI